MRKFAIILFLLASGLACWSLMARDLVWDQEAYCENDGTWTGCPVEGSDCASF